MDDQNDQNETREDEESTPYEPATPDQVQVNTPAHDTTPPSETPETPGQVVEEKLERSEQASWTDKAGEEGSDANLSEEVREKIERHEKMEEDQN